MNNTAFYRLPTQSLLPRFTPRCIKGVQSTILAGCLSIALLSPATAADFSGKLTGVSITDAQATNKPPTAVINYTQNNGTFIFDAGQSSDQDGTITTYKWDFSDGTKKEGLVVNHVFNSLDIYLATLTVTDNSGGIAISQASVSKETLISDDFNRVDGMLGANWTAMTGFSDPLIASNMVTRYAVSWAALYTGTAFSNDQYARITLVDPNSCSVYVRGSINNSGYSSEHFGNEIRIYKTVAGVRTYIPPSYPHTPQAFDILGIKASGSSTTTLTATLNGADVLTVTDSSSPILNGYPGFRVYDQNGKRLDNFEAGNL